MKKHGNVLLEQEKGQSVQIVLIVFTR